MWLTGWILSFIPDGLFLSLAYLVLAAGIILYGASKLVKWFPVIDQYKLISEVLGILLLVVGSYILGSYGTEMVWRDRVAVLEQKVKEAEEKAKQANEKIVIEYRDKIKVVTKTKVVVQEKIKEVEKVIDGPCKIVPEAVEIHNQAATMPKEAKK